MVDAQEYLDKHYPKEKRNKVTNLDLRYKELEGELVIENWPNLSRLDCGFNQLTKIKINNLPKLNFFSARNCQLSTLTINNCSEIGYFNVKKNFLTDLVFISGLNPEKLTFLDIGDNSFSQQDLSAFSPLINLEELYFGNSFDGSLEPLKGLTRLKNLGIFTPNINGGLEYLSASLERIYCHNLDKENDTSPAIWEEVKNYSTEDSLKFICYDYQAWRKYNAERIDLANIDKLTLLRQFKSLEQEKKEMQEKIKKLQDEMTSLENKLSQNSPAIVISPNFSNIATGSVSTHQGNTLLGNTLGDNSNLSYETVTHQQETKVIEKKEQLEAKIEQSPKTKLWKQLFTKKS